MKYFKDISIKKFIFSNSYEIILLLISTIYFLYFTFVTFARHENFYSRRFDLGNMDQTVWNTLHGHIFMFTNPYSTEQISRLTYHADFILILLSPFYLIWTNPKMLLLIQSLIISFGGIFVYLISREVLKNKTISLALALAFYLNPAIQHANLYDFHGVVLGTTFLLAAFYFILKKNWWLVLLFLFLAGITKEQVWAITAIFGLYIIFVSKKRLLGSLITITSLSLFSLLFWVVIPSFSVSGQHFALKFLTEFGSNPTEIVFNMLKHPIEVLKVIVTSENLSYLNKLFIPLGFLSIFGIPLLIFATPDLLINLISNNPSMKGIWNQYTATISPFIFIAAIYGIRFIISKVPKLSYKLIAIFIVIMTLISAYLYGPMFFSKNPIISDYLETVENKESIDSYLNSLPIESKIAVTNNLGAHLSYRKNIYLVQFASDQADYAIFLIRNPFKSETDAFEKVSRSKNFKLEFQDNNFYVFKRIKQ